MRNSYQNSTTGFLAIGQCDNQGEGQQDVWICHIDSLGDTLKTETLGGEENDYGHAVVLVPQLFSAFIAGYNNSYGITESGNAYLGGVKVDMGLPDTGPCFVTRTMLVDFFVWYDNPNTYTIDLTNYILGNASKEQDLIDYAEDNEISYLVLMGSNWIFDPRYFGGSLSARQKLSDFIAACRAKDITCALVSNPTLQVFTNGIQYNQDVVKNASLYNYNRNGKLTYFFLEHEFWRANDQNTFPNSPSNPAQMDAFYQSLYTEHKDLLTDLKANKGFDANVHGLHDYIAWFYHSWNNASNGYNYTNTTARNSKASELEKLSDAIFLAYYQKYSYLGTSPPYGEEGHDFLSTNATSGTRYFNVERWKERISYLGQNTRKTVVVPLFSSEIYNSTVLCGEDDFMGAYLEDAPGNGTGSLQSAETFYQSQHATIYSNTTSYPDVQNTEVGALAWFKYSCMDAKDFGSNSGRVECSGFNIPLELDENKRTNSNLIVVPNPSNLHFTIRSNIKDLVELKVYNMIGSVIYTKSGSGQQEMKVVGLDPGAYSVVVTFSDNSIGQIKALVLE
jgi:hypothetical protein